jgi:hypothetical protein
VPPETPDNVEVRDVADGLWLWRTVHPEWFEGADFQPLVSSFAVESGGESILLDPLAPPPGARAVWDRIEARPPGAVIVLKPDHVRDVELFVRWYGAHAYGPDLFFPGDAPATAIEPIWPGVALPGGLRAFDDGRRRNETPLYLPEQRALVFADGMTAPQGELRVWATRWPDAPVLPALRELLELPFEHVLVSHGEPVHSRADFEAALGREPYGG